MDGDIVETGFKVLPLQELIADVGENTCRYSWIRVR